VRDGHGKIVAAISVAGSIQVVTLERVPERDDWLALQAGLL